MTQLSEGTEQTQTAAPTSLMSKEIILHHIRSQRKRRERKVDITFGLQKRIAQYV